MKTFIKRLTVLLLALCLISSLAGCETEDNQTSGGKTKVRLSYWNTEETMAPLLRLLAEKLPDIEVEYNYVEMASVGKLRVRQILENGGKTPAIITVKDNPSLPDIRKELEKHDLPWDETLLIHDEKKVKKLLDKWIREKKADSVMCDGISNGIFHTLFETLQSHPEFTGPVSISDTRYVRYELKKYPSLPCRICFSHHTTEELGIEAARMALRAAESRKMQPPVFVQCAYPEKESSN